ncbi:NCS2 family permease [Nonomuraea sp. LP-02]|uniref:NCS2 family permease n=1 Tax=Nonomuraea sp. LP-02 TaxID=3097960 RepID=UPI002E2FA6B4|nr:NCS2 family permease [Nonomuraea sp. LP-02]MED7929375.1 NCS2 family permease [Nonomuraea sp. LP-02]
MSDTKNTEPRSALDRFFAITARGSTVSREVRGGLATFFTMAYIVVLNPLIIATGKDIDGEYIGDGSTPNIALVAAGTAFVAGVMTILMGVIGKVPFAMAAGLGLNAFVTFNIATVMSWEEAMGLVFLEGVIIAILVLTGLRTAVFHAIPAQLKTAISVGIGLFIALIGFVDAGFVRKAQGTPLELGIAGNLTSWPIFVFIVGLLATAAMVARKVKGAILIGIVGTTILAIVVEALTKAGNFSAENPGGWQLNRPTVPEQIFGFHNPLTLFAEFDPIGGFQRVTILLAVLFVFTLLITDFFDTMGTVVGVGRQAGLVQEDGMLPRTKQILLVDSIGAAAGGAGSVSSNTTYIESAAGVGEGARTGLASVVTGALFLVAIFFAPLVTVVPYEAAAPALVVVGFLMMTAIRDIDWNDYEMAIPAFLTIVIMPFTYSVSNGIGAGFISYVLIKVVRGKAREVHPLLWGTAVLFVLYFAIGPIRALLGI